MLVINLPGDVPGFDQMKPGKRAGRLVLNPSLAAHPSDQAGRELDLERRQTCDVSLVLRAKKGYLKSWKISRSIVISHNSILALPQYLFPSFSSAPNSFLLQISSSKRIFVSRDIPDLMRCLEFSAIFP